MSPRRKLAEEIICFALVIIIIDGIVHKDPFIVIGLMLMIIAIAIIPKGEKP